MIRSYIAGIGMNIPSNVITNDQLAPMVGCTSQWIEERTGIQERRYVNPKDKLGSSDLSIKAVEEALDRAQLSKNDIDLIIFSTSHPDYYMPGSGYSLQAKMGFPNIGVFDIRAQCCGFLYGLSIADQFIKTQAYKNVLLVCSEIQSTIIDFSPRGRDHAVLFADGAAATVISGTKEERGVMSVHLHSDGRFAEELTVESPSAKNKPRMSPEILEEGRQFLKMNGKLVFKHAVTCMSEAIGELLEENRLTTKELDLVIMHQANLRICSMIQEKLMLKDEQVFSNVQRYGNTTSASVPIAIYEAIEQKKIKNGDKVALAAFGAGFTWGSSFIQF